jgi:hypothetical protein
LKERLLTSRYDFSKHSPVNPEMAEKHGVKMKKPGEVTLESEFEKIKKVRSNRLGLHQMKEYFSV